MISEKSQVLVYAKIKSIKFFVPLPGIEVKFKDQYSCKKGNC